MGKEMQLKTDKEEKYEEYDGLSTKMTESTLHIDHVPIFAREKFICTGYRRRLSLTDCFLSWFWWHNETLNIWSHFLGFLFFSYILVRNLVFPPAQLESRLELIPSMLQLVSYQLCLLSSTLFHTFSCHSPEVRANFLNLDHFGILFAVFGNYVSFVCDTFKCHPGWRNFHLGTVSLVFAWFVWRQYLGNSGKHCGVKNKRISLRFFLLLSLLTAVPLSHWISIRGVDALHVQAKVMPVLTSCALAATGLVFYTSRFPEKFCCSADIFGQSHQIWHVFIFLAMVFWHRETFESYVHQLCPSQATPDLSLNSLWTPGMSEWSDLLLNSTSSVAFLLWELVWLEEKVEHAVNL